MKRVVILLFSLCLTSLLMASKHCCPDPEEFDRLQELQRCIDTIKSKVCKIQNAVERIDTEIDNLTVVATCSGLDDLELEVSILGEILCSKIEDLDLDISILGGTLCSKIEDLDLDISILGGTLCSKIEDLDLDVSILGETLCSKLEDIESSIDSITGCAPIVLSSADVVSGGIILSTPGN